jgi:hypothetical protein
MTLIGLLVLLIGVVLTTGILVAFRPFHVLPFLAVGTKTRRIPREKMENVENPNKSGSERFLPPVYRGKLRPFRPFLARRGAACRVVSDYLPYYSIAILLGTVRTVGTNLIESVVNRPFRPPSGRSDRRPVLASRVDQFRPGITVVSSPPSGRSDRRETSCHVATLPTSAGLLSSGTNINHSASLETVYPRP